MSAVGDSQGTCESQSGGASARASRSAMFLYGAKYAHMIVVSPSTLLAVKYRVRLYNERAPAPSAGRGPSSESHTALL